MIKENAAISAQVVELRKQIDMVSLIDLLKLELQPSFRIFSLTVNCTLPFSEDVFLEFLQNFWTIGGVVLRKDFHGLPKVNNSDFFFMYEI